MLSCRCLVGVLLICALAQLSSVSGAQTTAAAKQQSSNADGAPTHLLARFRGVLPCADCPGIDTELSLFADSPNEPLHTRYALKRTYLERGKSYTEVGTWELLRGTPDDPNATIYQLKSKDGGQPANFLRVSDDQIVQLDNERHRFDAKLNFSLKKVTAKADH